jgi:hypothetical protein
MKTLYHWRDAKVMLWALFSLDYKGVSFYWLVDAEKNLKGLPRIFCLVVWPFSLLSQLSDSTIGQFISLRYSRKFPMIYGRIRNGIEYFAQVSGWIVAFIFFASVLEIMHSVMFRLLPFAVSVAFGPGDLSFMSAEGREVIRAHAISSGSIFFPTILAVLRSFLFIFVSPHESDRVTSDLREKFHELERLEQAYHSQIARNANHLALISARKAAEVLESTLFSDRPWLNRRRAALWNNVGKAEFNLGNESEALVALLNAQHYYEAQLFGAVYELNLERVRLYCLISQLLQHLDLPNVWAISVSDRLIQMLDLDPRGDAVPWPELRHHFALFHVNWLRHCLAGGADDRAMVPRVLNALQGRRLAAEVIEAALEVGDADPSIRDYARLKGEMRELLRQIETAEGRGLGAFDIGDGPDGGESDVRVLESFGGSFAARIERRLDEGLLERLRADYRVKEQALIDTRDKVAKLSGFEVLGQPLGMMSLEAVQSRLAPGEALVLALPLGWQMSPEFAIDLGANKSITDTRPRADNPEGFETRLWVLGSGGDPEVITLPETAARDLSWGSSLCRVGQAFAAFNAVQSGRTGLRRGGWGSAKVVNAAKDGAVFEISSVTEDTLTWARALHGEIEEMLPGMPEAETFWPRMVEAMERLFWSPLRASGALDGVETLLLATTGPLHNLPFSAGHRAEDPALWQVNSLVTWALGRGLYRAGDARAGDAAGRADRNEGAAADQTSSPIGFVGVLSNPKSTDIPLAGVEVAVAARLWQAAVPGLQVIADTAHPWHPAEALRLVHLACHGDIDTRPGETPHPVIGLVHRGGDTPTRVLTERHLLAGPRADEVLMNLCVGGQAYDDLLDGDPTGLIPAWLRNGAHTVVAAVPLVPDAFGALFGTTVTLLMTDPVAPLPLAAAARQAARILGEDPGLASSRLAARLAEVLPQLAAREVATAIGAKPKARRAHIQAMQAMNAIAVLLKSRPVSIWWLPPDGAQKLAGLPRQLGRVPTEAEIATLLAFFRPDPDRDGIRAAFPNPEAFPLHAQTIQYGYAVFGDPARRHNH